MGIRRHSPCADCAAHHPCVHARQLLCHATNWCTHAPRLRAVRAVGQPMRPRAGLQPRACAPVP